MAVSDTIAGSLRLTTVDSVPAGATVRHADQLSDEAFAQVVKLVTEDGPRTLRERPAPDLKNGEIIVFTDYLQVQIR
ncbi:hypothetical protein [Haloarchaeobius sp. TZWWS8]|uniref:hypothetical protein n=1 Tax=Haloarchaeobius sp. TZWWS8 TaxID=3446121 RepID=UPI003EBDA6C0